MQKIIVLLQKVIDIFTTSLKMRKAAKTFNEKWFESKSVAIVGGADSVLYEENGQYIDSFDVVVRINKGVETIEKQSKHVGTRTDFLFHSFYEKEGDTGSSPITLELWQDKGVKEIIFANNMYASSYGRANLNFFLRKQNNKNSFCQLPLFLFKKIASTVKPFGPTTGYTAIIAIHSCRPSKIYLTGFTFFRTPSNALYRVNNIEQLNRALTHDHSADIEFNEIRNLYHKGQIKIETDIPLKNLFN